jgi:UDP-N-acetylglucosamine--N-acetylmuramyl-(pentapeptide) pyrophosphoryl-undecaprenol N-acetylglucosamine transferase
VVIPDRELTAARLRATVQELLGDDERLATMAAASASLARPDAASDIADELVA